MPLRRGPRPCHASSGSVSLGRPAAAAFDRPPARGAPAGLAPGRADLGARYRRAGPVRGRHARASGRRRHHHRRDAFPARDRGGGIADGSAGMTALAALIRRDIRIALRVGGGALIGVLFFLTVTVLMPFAVGPDLALLTRLGPAILWLGALLASLLTLDRLFTADHEDGSLDLIVMGRAPLELACAAKALAHWLAAGVPLAVLVLPLSIPVLIFGVAASQAAITGPLSFGTPFSILCALSLVSLVVGPFAAAASLRHGLD